MGLKKLEFSKVWTNPDDFPRYEASEEKVRADMQLLYDELQVALNRLVSDLDGTQGAENLGFRAVSGIDANTVQEAIEIVLAQIGQAALSEIPNGSITPEKVSESLIQYLGCHLSMNDPGAEATIANGYRIGKRWYRPGVMLTNGMGLTNLSSNLTISTTGGTTEVTDDGDLRISGNGESADVSVTISGLSTSADWMLHGLIDRSESENNPIRVYVQGTDYLHDGYYLIETTLPQGLNITVTYASALQAKDGILRIKNPLALDKEPLLKQDITKVRDIHLTQIKIYADEYGKIRDSVQTNPGIFVMLADGKWSQLPVMTENSYLDLGTY